MKTVVLDDDPTGTQSATGVRVLLEFNADSIESALAEADSVYVQTNSRAIDEGAAIALVSAVRDDSLEAGRRLGVPVQFVLRGDSTLRGHVFAESEVFADPESVIVFVPAFPAGGRTTVEGVHYVELGGQRVAAHETELARDPIFPFTSSDLTAYVAEKSTRTATRVAAAVVRSGGFGAALLAASPGSVVVPDAETDDDIRAIAAGIRFAREHGLIAIVRSAAPLAAELAGVPSDGLLPTPLRAGPVRTLLACGSHTDGATAQLAEVVARFGDAVVVDTDLAMRDASSEGARVASTALTDAATSGIAIISTERHRRAEHNTLADAERVMAALTAAVSAIAPSVEVVIAKGGITSAELARTGLGATSAWVLGQVLPGVSVWDLVTAEGDHKIYVVVPGNVGGPDTLVRILAAVGC